MPEPPPSERRVEVAEQAGELVGFVLLHEVAGAYDAITRSRQSPGPALPRPGM